MTFSDADHGGCKDSSQSTGGYVIKIGMGAMSSSLKLKGVVALSSTKSEYSTTTEASKEICWMHNLLSEMGFKNDILSILHMDNQSAIQVTKNPEHHGQMKQLDLKLFWLQDNIEQKLISPTFTQMDQMPADILTKCYLSQN